MEKREVVVGKRTYQLERGTSGEWLVSRGGLPVGAIRVTKSGDVNVEPKSPADFAAEELRDIVNEARKLDWWHAENGDVKS